MYSKIDKLNENKSWAVANAVSRSLSSASSNFSFIDNRSESIAQRKLPEVADNSPRAMQLLAVQAVVNNYSAQQQQILQKKENNTGLPDNLKSGVESLSGYSMDDVKVHYNSNKPTQLNAHAYAQGTDIHLASGQEKHLPHEAWHVVQQKQGRVKPTLKIADGVNVNDDANLEKEADIMGGRALQDNSAAAIGLQLKKTSYLTSFIQKFQCSTVQKKRMREEESLDLSQLKQFKKPPLQLKAETAQLAITDQKEAPPGTRIIVVNHEASDTGDIGTVIRLSKNQAKCMVVEFDNEPHVMYRVYFREIDVISMPDQGPSSEVNKSEDKLLHEMIMKVIANVAAMPDELNKVMEPDKTWAHGVANMSPQQQLQKCIQDCKNKSAEETAIYLYTTYFYSPLNKYLRDSKNANMGGSVEKLISITHAFLMRAFRATPGEKLTAKFRMELKPGWIGDKGVGEELSFQGFTSTHPELEGVNNMWGDIEKGAFGDYDKQKLALLIFEGDSKLLRPDVKYFPNENEMVLPAGIKAKITKKYDIAWYGWKVAVYHLIILPETQNPSDFNVTFEESGNVVVDKKMTGE